MTGIGENTLAQPVKPPLRERRACLAKLVKNRLTLTDFCTKEIVASDISTTPDMAQQARMLDELLPKIPEGAAPTMHSDRGWQYQHASYTSRLEAAGIVQSMSRKANCIDNAATEQLFGHVKDEFYRGREWKTFEDFKRDLEEYIVHWNTSRRQVRLKGLTPEEFRNQALAA